MTEKINEKVVEFSESDMRVLSGKTRIATRSLADILFTIGEYELRPEKGIQELYDQDTETKLTFVNDASEKIIEIIRTHIEKIKEDVKSEGPTTKAEEGPSISS